MINSINDDEDEKNEDEAPESESVENFGQTIIKNKKGNIRCVTIIGQIEGHMQLGPQTKTTKYEHLLPQLALMEEDEETDGVLFLLNTVGGDVEAGLAISEMISGMSKPTVSLVLGGGHSIGIPLAVATKHSFISPTATMTVHPIRTNGLVIGVIQSFEYLDKMQKRISRFVENNSNISADNFRSLMLKTGELANDVGTILFGEEAVTCGLIDECGGIKDAYEKLYSLIIKQKDEKKTEKESEKKAGKETKKGTNKKAEKKNASKKPKK
jgi:Protease subunit of ATP-dependent Clp proteases